MLIIGRGKLYRDAGEAYGVSLPCWQYQVRNAAGVACEHSYTGPGFDNGARIMVGRADSAALAEYHVDDAPTQESLDEVAGFLARLRQIRATFPVKASAAFQDGWRDADMVAKRETAGAKAARLLAVRFEREAAAAARSAG